MYEEVM